MKADKNKKPSFFSELGIFMKPYKGKYILSILVSIIAVTSSLLSYVFVGKIAGILFSDNPLWRDVLLFVLLAILMKFLYVLLLNLSTYISHKSAYHTLKDIRLAFSNKMLKLPIGYFEENGSGRLKTMFCEHVEDMEKTLAHMLPELTANALVPLSLIVWIFTLDYRLALIILLWIFIGLMVTSGMMKNYPKKYEGQLNALKNMNQNIVEYTNGIEVIKNFGRADECNKKYQDAVQNHANYNVNWQKETLLFTSLSMAIAPFSIFPVLIFGIIFYSNNTLDASTLFMISILTFGIFGPIMNASSYFDQLATLGTNAQEIKNILNYPELNRGKDFIVDNTNITFKNVSFSYKNNDIMQLKNISFEIPEHTMFALVGPSGSGKSTIAKLIAGYWDATSGEILIGNKKITSLSQETINSLISFVDQDTFLFDESIFENIKLSNPTATLDDVIKIAKETGCHEFISNLPDGYNTKAGIAGNMLSGGEKQRIAILRAMMKDAPIMILDEATASADPENEEAIQKAISTATKDKTLIVIAHHLNTIINADNIAFVKDGEIKQIGTHHQLLNECDDYKNLYNLMGENND